MGSPLIRVELDQDTPLKGRHESIIKQSPNVLLDQTKGHKPVDHVKGLHRNLSDTVALLAGRCGTRREAAARRSQGGDTIPVGGPVETLSLSWRSSSRPSSRSPAVAQPRSLLQRHPIGVVLSRRKASVCTRPPFKQLPAITRSRNFWQSSSSKNFWSLVITRSRNSWS